MTNWRTDCGTDAVTGWLTDWLNHWLTDRKTNWAADCLSDLLTEYLFHYSCIFLSICSLDWLNGLLTDSLTEFGLMNDFCRETRNAFPTDFLINIDSNGVLWLLTSGIKSKARPSWYPLRWTPRKKNIISKMSGKVAVMYTIWKQNIWS